MNPGPWAKAPRHPGQQGAPLHTVQGSLRPQPAQGTQAVTQAATGVQHISRTRHQLVQAFECLGGRGEERCVAPCFQGIRQQDTTQEHGPSPVGPRRRCTLSPGGQREPRGADGPTPRTADAEGQNATCGAAQQQRQGRTAAPRLGQDPNGPCAAPRGQCRQGPGQQQVGPEAGRIHGRHVGSAAPAFGAWAGLLECRLRGWQANRGTGREKPC